MERLDIYGRKPGESPEKDKDYPQKMWALSFHIQSSQQDNPNINSFSGPSSSGLNSERATFILRRDLFGIDEALAPYNKRRRQGNTASQQVSPQKAA